MDTVFLGNALNSGGGVVAHLDINSNLLKQEIMFRYWASYIFSLMGIMVYIDKFTDLIKFIIECLTATEDECDFYNN